MAIKIRQLVDAELRANAAALAAGGTLSVDVGVGQAETEFAAVDAIGCSFLQLTLRTDRLAGHSPDDLKDLGDKLAARLTYLLEPISPLELDPEGFTLQLRSSPPQKDDDGTCYYEILARRGGELSLCRYKKEKGKSRARVPAAVTREIICRLVEDFAAVVE